MSQTVEEMQKQMAINESMWFNAAPAGQTLLHNRNIALQASIDAAKGTTTVYNAPTGTYTPAPTQVVQSVTNVPKVTTAANASSVTSYPTSNVSASTAAVVSAVDKRNAEAAAFTGWDNDPTIRAMQTKGWDIYIATGSWTSPEQLQLHSDSEAARKAINPTYTGAAWGTASKAAADALILPDNMPNVTGVSNSITGALKSLVTGVTGATSSQGSGLLKIGVGVGGLLLVMSMLRGRH